jgi:putative glutamine amidotransferase
VRIGLTHTGNPEKHRFYLDWLAGNEDIEIRSLSYPAGNLEELDQCQALVLSGGLDIHPRFYRNSKLGYPNAPGSFDEARDKFELEALNRALARKIPILGICRGMQLINTALGGTLLQDLPSANPKIVHVGNPDKLHDVKIAPGSLLNGIGGMVEGAVNTAHHQAVEIPGMGLRVTCYAPDGVAEAIEWDDPSGKGFLLGVQWHPERMFRFRMEGTPLSANIRARLLEEMSLNINNK